METCVATERQKSVCDGDFHHQSVDGEMRRQFRITDGSLDPSGNTLDVVPNGKARRAALQAQAALQGRQHLSQSLTGRMKRFSWDTTW